MKKDDKISIKWKIFGYIMLFTTFIIVLLWLLQVVFLDDFYRKVKSGQIKETTQNIVENINNDNIVNYLDDLSANSDYCVRILDINGKTFYVNDTNRAVCGETVSDPQEMAELYEKAKKNKGSILNISDSESIYSSIKDYFNPYEFDSENKKDTFETMTYGKIVEDEGYHYFVLVNSRITITDELADTIRKQLLLVSVILLILALVMAGVVATLISSPIIKMNKAAKKLAQGEYNVHFDGKGYLEIEELNDTLNYASKELSKVENLRRELIANMSHDLRTPLTMIAGYGEVMRDIPGENTPENVQVIIDECKRLTTIVNDSMDLSKLQAKTQTLNVSEFCLSEMIEETVKRFDILLKQEKYHIEFIYDKMAWVEADAIKISQVIYNLIVNAIHYTGEDYRVEVKQTCNNGIVRVEVRDSGEGISEEELPYIWERYYKIDKVHKRTQLGSGLGLSIVKGILELHQARYGVLSKIGEGTIFYFELEEKKSK